MCLVSLSSVQGSYNRPHLESSSQAPSLSIESALKGLQVELSETCALCLSRLLSLICVPWEPRMSDLAPVSPSGDDSVQLIPSSQLQLLFKLDCCLEDVNVFTLSNLAGEFFFLKIFFFLSTIGKNFLKISFPKVACSHVNFLFYLSCFQELYLCGWTPSESSALQRAPRCLFMVSAYQWSKQSQRTWKCVAQPLRSRILCSDSLW